MKKMGMGSMKPVMNRKVIQQIVEAEPKAMKMKILGCALSLMVITIIFLGLYAARLNSVGNAQTMAERNPGYDDSVIAYDTGCISYVAASYALSAGVTDETTLNLIKTGLDQYYTSGSDAWDIWKDEAADCDEDCLKMGSRWSIAMMLNMIGMIIVILQLCCVSIGAYKATFRFIGAVCANLVCCYLFAIGIVTFVFRGNAMGRICALSTLPTNAPTDKAEDVDDNWTYEKDGALILALSIITFLCCCSCGSASSMGLRPPAM